jgi:Protein of unknown function (DUF3662)/FHA domain
MGLMRRAESRIERTFEGMFGRRSKAYVHPPELATKLVKEMEATKRVSVSHTYVGNVYTVFLCPEDRRELGPLEEHLREELAAHLEEHARIAGYSLVGPVRVRMETDPELKLGRFGIRAEVAESPADEPLPPIVVRPPAADHQPGLRWDPGVSDRPSDAGAGVAPPLAADRPAGAGSLGAAGKPLARPASSETQSIPANVARDLDLARQVIVLREGSHRREFHKTRIVLGRSRECDFPLDDANVSRRHAVIYWETGTPFLKDLESTNGTLLNGRPVTSGQLADGDVLTLGGTPITIELG